MGFPQSAYVHVPFCRHRCGYCNFTLVAGRDDLIEDYLKAIEIELGWLKRPRPVTTLFIGGGTPTRLNPSQLNRLLHRITHWFPLRANGEFSVEANPADITPDKVELMRQAGVTRLSLGAQSWNPQKLVTLERDHDATTVEAAARIIRPEIPQLSIDLIFAVPSETRDIWRRDLQQTIRLNPDHVSTYGLTYERGTAFFTRRLHHKIMPIDEEDERWMYETAIDDLTAAGWEHYEVSNFARAGGRCRHNEAYWMGDEYYAAGPGAARYINGCRETNHRSTTTYLRRVLGGLSPVAERELLSAEDRARERLVFGLRRLDGVDLSEFRRRSGFDLPALAEPALSKFHTLGLLEIDDGRVRLTRKGLLVSDAMWPEFLRG